MTRVLVVDPNVARRSMIRGRIADAGHGALAAVDVEEGQATVETVGVDLVLLSDDLPEDGARDLCAQIKSAAGYPPSVIIYEGEQGGGADSISGYRAGCDRFMSASEMGAMEHVVGATLQSKVGVDAVREHNRMLALEHQSLNTADDCHGGARRDIVDAAQAAGRPDAVFIVDSAGTVVSSDAGAHRIFGKDHEGRSLDDLAPGRGLQAHIRDARCASIEGLRFDLPGRGGRPARHFQASVYPLHASSPKEPQGMRVILFVDIGRRIVADDLLRDREEGLTERQVSNLMETAARAYGPHTILGESEPSRNLRAAALAASGRRSPLLVVGPRGTRRRDIARAVHFGVQAPGSFLFMHCASLSTESLESEFFGRASAAAGGSKGQRGLLSLAAGGTLLLEEIEVLPLVLQDLLAEAIVSGSFRQQGARALLPLEVRIVASSVHDRDTLEKRGSLSAALLAALGDDAIQVPRLAERREDLQLFAGQMLERIAGRETSKLLAPEVLWLLQQHDWPENLDELEASLRRACAAAHGDRIGIEHLDAPLRRLYADLTSRGLAPTPRSEGAAPPDTNRNGNREPVPHEWDVTSDDPISFDAYERKAILRALAACGGDKQGVARLLKVGKSTLYRKLNRLDI